MVTDTLRESRELAFADDHAERSLRGHRRILAAIQEHDPTAARAAMDEHLDAVEELIRLLLPTI